MIKKISLYISSFLVLFTACEKEENANKGVVDNSLSYVSFHNFSPSARPIDLLVDGTKVNKAGVVSANTTLLGTYFGAAPGARTISIRDTTSASTPSSTEYATTNITVEGGKSYSVFVYDTLTGGKLRTVVLNTDRSPTPMGKAGVRFLNTIPNLTAPVDLWLFTFSGTTVSDSIKLFSSVPYIGTAPDGAALSAFTLINANTYQVRLRPAGSNTNLAVTPTGTAMTTFADTRKYTIVARGRSGGTGSAAIALTIVPH